MYAGIDCGTQGTKVVIYDSQSGSTVGLGYAEHELISKADGTREQQPSWWISALTKAMKQALHTNKLNAGDIKALAVSGQQHGLVVLDEHDQVIRAAKLWNDTSTHQENEQLVAALGGKKGVIDTLGLMINTGYTASKILWLKQYEPENYQRVRSILLPHDYINFWLTGEKTTERGDASGTGYFDINKRCWSALALQCIDSERELLSYLPRIISADQSAGLLSAKAGAALGLKPGIVVASGGGDNMMGAIGTGNIEPGQVTISLGTSGTVYANMDKPCIDKNGLIAGFCSSSDSWLPLICTMNLTNVTSQTQSLLQIDYSTMDQMLEQTSIGAQGLLMLPFLNGERTPEIPTATGSLVGINASNFTRQNLYRATVEGTSFGLKYGLDLLRKQGLEATEIRLIGGGAKSKQWRQILADMLNLPVVVPMETEAGALGAALQAQWCYQHVSGNHVTLKSVCDIGVKLDESSRCQPRAKHVVDYQKVYESYQQYKQQLYAV